MGKWTQKKRLFDAKTEFDLPPRGALTKEGKVWREKILEYIWEFHVKDEIDMANLIQTETEFSHVITDMDILDCWYEGEERRRESMVGGRLAACMDLFGNCRVQWTKKDGRLQGPNKEFNDESS